MIAKKKDKKVFVGLSGGVDSSTAAYLLKNKGYEVTGVFIKVWQPDFVVCNVEEDRLDAMRICAHLNIPFLTLDLEEEYKHSVIDYMISEYAKGRTPNPDVICNREVKFGAFLRFAESKGANFIATGHYAQIIKNNKLEHLELHRGVDEGKDQSYFLWTLSKKELSHTLFPVGRLRKSEVREIARRAGLHTFSKKDSQGLCFLGAIDVKEFLKRFIPPKRGNVLNEEGEIIGHHDGAAYFTIGERHGFTTKKNVSTEKPYYVIAKDVVLNTITVSSNVEAPESAKAEVNLESVNVISPELDLSEKEQIYEGRIRYRSPLIKMKINWQDKKVLFDTPILVSSGQSLVIYRGNRCVGGGIIC